MKEDWLDETFERYALSSLDDMYASIGYGGISCTQIVNKLRNLQKMSELILDFADGNIIPVPDQP